MILVGLRTRYAALTLAAFSLLTAVVFRHDIGDPIEQFMFLENVAMRLSAPYPNA